MSHLHRQLAAQAAMAEKPAEETAATLCDAVPARVVPRQVKAKKGKVRGKKKA